MVAGVTREQLWKERVKDQKRDDPLLRKMPLHSTILYSFSGFDDKKTKW
jgi:hypothetical protein